ncbi:alpha/beta hydrolase family protein [Pseudonocardia aurantiaca]|uniref:Alpha/beta hydrolase family protein n=1 Tax=Pseudonocardia aurantiaca TaxID=75290 RepID=A0ABW4FWP8_9PSEU
MRRSILGLLVPLLAVALAAGCSASAPPPPAPPPATPPPATAVPTVEGDWHGRIELPGSPLDIGVRLTGGGGTFDLPAQGLLALPLTNLRVTDRSVRFDLPDVPGNAAFDGVLSEDGTSISGNYTQAGQTLPFSLARGPLAAPARPQEPHPPFPYRSDDVIYPSGSLTLAGTLTRPVGAGPFPAVLLLSGSGPQDRDESISGHKLFLLLADRLTRAGFAVLRADDRGVGGSGGDLGQATYDDLAADALAGVAFLQRRPDVDPGRIGLLGHSEGGYLAPLVTQRAAGVVEFVVLVAGPAVRGQDVLELQNRMILEQVGAPPAQVEAQVAYVRELSRLLAAGQDDAARQLARDRITEQIAALPADQRPTPEEIEAQLPVSPAFRSFVTYDPAPALAALNVPVLALFGGKDLQVPPSQSEPAMRALLAGNPAATVRVLPGLNHLMQPAATGSPTEYASIETTMAPEALDLITGWLQENAR